MKKEYKYIFGPVPSRRLGNSLGIDLLVKKICSFDCPYCEVGNTVIKTDKREEYVPFNEVLDELKEYLYSNFNTIDFITFSGSGEPTLYSRLGEMINEIKKMSDIPIAVITNSSTITDNSVFNDLLLADLVMPSIDAIEPNMVKKINNPLPKFSMNKIVEGLAKFNRVYKGKLWLEILVCKGINDKPSDFKKLKEVVDKIAPSVTLINTVARPSMSGSVSPISKDTISEIIEIIGETAKDIKPYSIKSDNFEHNINSKSNESKEALVYSLLRIRSCHFDEICHSTSISSYKLKNILDQLNEQDQISTYLFENVIYYKINSDITKRDIYD